jgi:hypothetical protein
MFAPSHPRANAFSNPDHFPLSARFNSTKHIFEIGTLACFGSLSCSGTLLAIGSLSISGTLFAMWVTSSTAARYSYSGRFSLYRHAYCQRFKRRLIGSLQMNGSLFSLGTLIGIGSLF